MPGQPSLRALVLGGAGTLPADRAAALELFEPDLVIACNHAGRDEPRVDHWCSMHPNMLTHWLARRRQLGRADPQCCWHPDFRSKQAPKDIATRGIANWGGSSGLLCVGVALELGCTHVVLAGVPLDKMAGHYDDPKPWVEARQYRWAWERRKELMEGRVKSMSGWTAELLGKPTGEWLDA